MIAKRKPRSDPNLTVNWSVFCLLLIVALAITVGVLVESY